MQNDLMVASDLQDALVEEITELLSETSSTNAQGEAVTGVTGYKQFLPVLRNDDDTPDMFFPYFIVRIDGATTEDDNDLWNVRTDILIGIHDEGDNNQGHKVMLNAITRIVNRFSQEATLGKPGHKAFRCQSKMEWALQDEDTWPCFFGGVSLTFSVPKPSRKDPILDGYDE